MMDNPLEFTRANAMRLQAMLEKLDMIYLANLKWKYKHNIDSFFKSTYIS